MGDVGQSLKALASSLNDDPGEALKATCFNAKGRSIIHVLRSEWPSDEHGFLVPSFHCMISLEGSEWSLKLIAYNGTVVEEFNEKLLVEPEEALGGSSLLKRFRGDGFALCQGVHALSDFDRHRLVEAVWDNLALETFQSTTIARSRQCRMGLVKGPEGSSSSFRCSECEAVAASVRLLSGIKTEPFCDSRLSLLKNVTVVRVQGLEETVAEVAACDPFNSVTVTSRNRQLEFGKVMEEFWLRRNNETAAEAEPRKPQQRKKVKSPTRVVTKEEIRNHEKKCPICEEPFRDVNEFMTHLSRCNVLETSEDDGGDLDEEAKSRRRKRKRRFKYAMEPVAQELKCKVCCQVLKLDSYKTHMRGHERKFHLDEEVACPKCQASVPKRGLNPHFEEAHDSDSGCCFECLKVMPSVEVKAHLAREHGPNKPKSAEGQLCPTCGKRCFFTSDLELHLATHHLPTVEPAQQEEAMCHVCGKVFSHRYKLKQHLSNIHNKTFKHTCRFCQKAFNLRHQLTKHLVTHSDIKPFKCKYCDYKNARKYRVLKHVQKQHQGATGTEDDMELLGGTAKTSEFVQNVFGI